MTAFVAGRAIGHATYLGCYGTAGSVASILRAPLEKNGKAFVPHLHIKRLNLMHLYRGGLLKYSEDITLFLVPHINSHKRFHLGTFVPTRVAWRHDNRTVGFRLRGEGSDAVRVKCRVGGADLNPYIAFAALIAAGLSTGLCQHCFV